MILTSTLKFLKLSFHGDLNTRDEISTYNESVNLL